MLMSFSDWEPNRSYIHFFLHQNAFLRQSKTWQPIPMCWTGQRDPGSSATAVAMFLLRENYWGLEAAGLKPISPVRHWNHRDLSVKMWNNMKCCTAQPTEMVEIVLACTLVYVTCCYRLLYCYVPSKCSSHTTQNQGGFRWQPKMYAINWTRAADIFDAWCFSQPRLAWINSTRGHAKVVLCSFVKIC